MDKIKQVLKAWENKADEAVAENSMSVLLTLRDTARIQALVELFPGRTAEQIVSDLLSAALDEIEQSLPYIKGTKVIAEDEFGDPVYEDIGPTPAFEAAVQKYYQALNESKKT